MMGIMKITQKNSNRIESYHMYVCGIRMRGQKEGVTHSKQTLKAVSSLFGINYKSSTRMIKVKEKGNKAKRKC